MSNYIRRESVEKIFDGFCDEAGLRSEGVRAELAALLDGTDYDNGALERAQVTADNGNKTLVKLLLLLVAKGVITRAELVDVIAD